MKVPLRWLQEFIDLPETDPVTLAETLSMVGHKVENYQVLEPGWSEVLVGEVVAIDPHPEADRIRVCQVDVGAGPEQIICGAWNFEAGARVAVARPGAVLPGGLEIGTRTIRGVDSHGMICSERELGLGDDHTGILVLDGSPGLGTDLGDLVELPDVVFDLEITTNRPDALSLRGIARDLAAYYGVGYRTPARPLVTVEGQTSLQVGIEDPLGCRRFTVREIRGAEARPSPLWVRHRLAKAGMRAISNVVDVTNYVMMELGHPLHAFDGDSVEGDRLVVRRAAQGEELVTLDRERRSLHPEDLVIYDDAGPTSLSGTMGGLRSEVSDTTTRVLMEAASWDPPTIMFMSRRHQLRSEASTRFERGVDPNLTEEACQRAAAMVAELAGGEVLAGGVDVVATPVPPVTVLLTMGEVTQLLGEGFEEEQVVEILSRLGMKVEPGDPLRVEVPTYRPDITRAADLVEEVARIHGYFRFGESLPLGTAGGLTPEQRRLRVLHQALTGLGLDQAVTLPFLGVEDLEALGRHHDVAAVLRVSNPLREEEGRLRPTLLPGLLRAARYNLSHGAASLALFETARVFRAEPGSEDPRLPHQVERLAWVMVGELGPRRLGGESLAADAAGSLAILRAVSRRLRLEPILEPAGPAGFHPGRTAAVRFGDRIAGHVGELSPLAASAFGLPERVGVAELDLDPLLAPVPHPDAVAPSVFPHVDFDLSFLVQPETLVSQILAATSEGAGDLLEDAYVFDEFHGPDGGRAVAIRYRLRAPRRTLSAEEVAPVRAAMVEAAQRLGAQLRGA